MLKTKTKHIFLSLHSLIFLLIIVLFVSAVGSGKDEELFASIGNSRMILYLNVSPNEPVIVNKSILVNNINPIDVVVKLKPADDLSKEMIDINPQNRELILKPNESIDVPFTIKVDQPRRYNLRILVGFIPANSSIESSGVGLISNIIIIAKNATALLNSNLDSNQESNNQTNDYISNNLNSSGVNKDISSTENNSIKENIMRNSYLTLPLFFVFILVLIVILIIFLTYQNKKKKVEKKLNNKSLS